MLILNSYLLIASLYDMASLRVPNSLTLGFLSVIFAYRTLMEGLPGLMECLLIIVGVPLLLFYFFTKRAIGAADIKFLVALGCFVGIEAFGFCFLYGLLVSVPAIIYFMIVDRTRFDFFLTTGDTLTRAEENESMLPYIPPFAIGTIIYFYNPEFFLW